MGHPVFRASCKRIRVAMVLLSTAGLLATMPATMRSQSPAAQSPAPQSPAPQSPAPQSLATPAASDSAGTSTTPPQPDFTYAPPTQRTRASNYVFDAFGPYPLIGAAFAAGLGQSGNVPPEWGQGGEGYGKRIGSDFAIAAIATTARYGLARALKEDTLYYRCACKGVLPRLAHAAFSTLTARQGEDGHRVFSVPALLAPYAGSFTAVYGWYPSRFGAKDAFRIGNYTLLANVGGNIGLEFIYSGPHSLLSRLHLNDTHGAPVDAHDAPIDTRAAPVNAPVAPLEGTKN
jgi:hypothetical protein